MDILILLLAVAGMAAGTVWWSLSRPRRAGSTGFEHGETPTAGGTGSGDFFVLQPSATPIVREDRPPAARSLLMLGLAIAISTAVLVGVAWAIGWALKLQLDHYFRPGG